MTSRGVLREVQHTRATRKKARYKAMTLGMSFFRVGYSGSASDWFVLVWVRSSSASTLDCCMFAAIVSWFAGGGMEESREEVSVIFSESTLPTS